MSKFITVSFLVTLFGCSSNARVEELSERVARLEGRMKVAEKRQQPRRAARPDPNTIYRVLVRDDEPYRGSAQAPVTVVDIYEYACPHCARTAPVLEELVKKYDDQLRLVSKPFVVHPDVATLPALAACAANKQGRFVEFENELWKRAWSGGRLQRSALSKPALLQLAADVGLSLPRFVSDLDGEGCRTVLTRERKALSAIGVRGTPSFFINGRPFVGPRTVEGFSTAIAAELERAEASGIAAAEYYDHLMAAARPRL